MSGKALAEQISSGIVYKLVSAKPDKQRAHYLFDKW
jgi:hypothetical protein